MLFEDKKMTLDSKLLLGDTLIDRQHDQLFDSLERIAALREHSLNDEAVVDQLTRLNHLVLQHFVSEEALMKRVDFPVDQLAAHQAEHLRILEELTHIHIDIMQGRRHLVSDIVDQISNWISVHVVDFDLGLQPYITKATH
jgi:hemerythrin-like metal-binding protein